MMRLYKNQQPNNAPVQEPQSNTRNNNLQQQNVPRMNNREEMMRVNQQIQRNHNMLLQQLQNLTMEHRDMIKEKKN